MITMPGADYREVAVETWEGEEEGEEGYGDEALGTGRCRHTYDSLI